VFTGPEEGTAAGRGYLRAAHADREHVIDLNVALESASPSISERFYRPHAGYTSPRRIRAAANPSSTTA
jgi:hypothetical protein